MSADKIDLYISELNALKNYDAVKAERDGLTVRKKELDEEVAGLRERLSREEGARERAERELQSKGDENGGLRSKVTDIEIEVGVLRETQKLVGDVRMTLPHLRERIASVKAEEIVAGVKSGLDEEFNRRVDAESDRKSLEKLDRLKSAEWPIWLNVHAGPMLTRLESSFRQSIPNLLNEEWYVTYNRCGYSYSSTLEPEGLNELIRTGSITVYCGNPNCTDMFGILAYHYKMSFRKLIENRLNQNKPI